MPGHVGIIYQASNAIYLGRTRPERIVMLPDGSVLHRRSLQKVIGQESGHEYVERSLVERGARPPRPFEPARDWLFAGLADLGAVEVRHLGKHRYAVPIGSPARRRNLRIGRPSCPYPEVVDRPPPTRGRRRSAAGPPTKRSRRADARNPNPNRREKNQMTSDSSAQHQHHHVASPARRATRLVTLECGEESIPVIVLPVTKGQESAMRRVEFTADGQRIRRPRCAASGRPVTSADVVKMTAASNGEIVELSDAEIAALRSDHGRAKVETFVPLSALADGTYESEATYRLVPVRSRGPILRNAATARAFSVFLHALEDRKVAALVSVSLHGRPRWAAVLPDGRMHALVPAERMRAVPRWQPIRLRDRDRRRARRLVERVGIATPALHDRDAQLLRRYVDGKAGAESKRDLGTSGPTTTRGRPLDILRRIRRLSDPAGGAA